MNIKSILETITSDRFWKERIISLFMVMGYLVGNGVELLYGKVTDDPVIVWVIGITLGVTVIASSYTEYANYTSTLFKIFLAYLNFNIILAYGRSTISDVTGESFYLLFSYILFVLTSQGLDNKKELLLFSISEIAMYVGVSLYYREYVPIVTQPMQAFSTFILITGNYLLNIQRFKFTQAGVGGNIQFKSISENGRDSQFIVNKDFEIVYLNPAAQTLAGLPSTPGPSGKFDFLSLVSEADRSQVVEFVTKKVIGSKEKNSLEYKLNTGGGQEIWVESIFSTFEQSGGNAQSLIFAETRDIAARKKLESEIQQQLLAEELLIKHSNRFINLDRVDIQANIDIALEEFAQIIHAEGILVYRIYGKLNEEFRSGNQWFSDELKSLRNRFNLTIKINHPLLMFLRQLKEDKKLRGIYISPEELARIHLLDPDGIHGKRFYLVPLPSGNVVNGFIVIVFNESSEPAQPNFFSLIANMVSNAFTRLRTESRLHEVQLTNEFILRALPDWLYIIDKSGKFTGTNNYSSLNAYLPETDLVNKTIDDVLPENFNAPLKNALQTIVKDESRVSFDYEDTVIQKGHYFKASLSPFKANEYLLIVRDITDLKLAQKEMQNKADKLEKSNQELEQFAYVVSHDMKQPIRSIISFLGLLNKKHSGQLNEEAKEFINFSIESANKMDKLIKDILQFSRMDRQIEFVDKVNLNEIYKSVLRNLTDSITSNNAEVKTTELPIVLGNATMLSELFQNLIENGIKYNRNEKKYISIEVTEDESDWLFSFTDNGIGFDEEHSKQIFKIFKRLHTDAEFQGTGIGLTICQKAVDKHGGKIWAKSTKGQGSTFYFTLPKTH